MPPTIIVTVGRAEELAGAELLAPAAAVLPAADEGAEVEVVLLLDEHAVMVTAVAHAATRATREPLLRPILRTSITPLLRFEGKEKREKSVAWGRVG